MGLRMQIGNITQNGIALDEYTITSDTNFVFRSMTAMVNIFIQMSREMWEFDPLGNLYFARITNDLMDRIFEIYRVKECNHDITIVFFSRTYYESDCIEDFPPDLQPFINRDIGGNLYQDFYWLIIKNEKCVDPDVILGKMISAFQSLRHINESAHNFKSWNSDAYTGNILEMINLSLNVTEKQYMDCNFERLGQITIIVSPTHGVFEVDRNLYIITKERVIELGIVPYIICMGEPAYGILPYFKFKKEADDTLSYGADYVIPHWFDMSFYLSPMSDNPNVKHISRDFVVYWPKKEKESGRSTVNNGLFNQILPHQKISRFRAKSFSYKSNSYFKRKRSCSSSARDKVNNSLKQLIDPFNFTAPLPKTTENFLYKWDNAHYTGPNFYFEFYEKNNRRNSRSPQKNTSFTNFSSNTLSTISLEANEDIKPAPNFEFDGINTFLPPLLPPTQKAALAKTPPVRRILFGKTINLADMMTKKDDQTFGLPSHFHSTRGDERSDHFGLSQTSKRTPVVAYKKIWRPRLKIGIEWKALVSPACLPLTMNYVPEAQVMRRDYIVSDYFVLAEDLNETSNNDSSENDADEQYKSRGNRGYGLLEQLLFQRLRFGGQIVKAMSEESQQFFFPNSASQYSSNLLSRLIVNKRRGRFHSQQPREYLVCIGRSYHLLALTSTPSNTICVTIYKPRHTVSHYQSGCNSCEIFNQSQSKNFYTFNLRTAEDETFQQCQTHFRFERVLDNFMWNTLDTYIAGSTSYNLFPNMITTTAQNLSFPLSLAHSKSTSSLPLLNKIRWFNHARFLILPINTVEISKFEKFYSDFKNNNFYESAVNNNKINTNSSTINSKSASLEDCQKNDYVDKNKTNNNNSNNNNENINGNNINNDNINNNNIYNSKNNMNNDDNENHLAFMSFLLVLNNVRKPGLIYELRKHTNNPINLKHETSTSKYDLILEKMSQCDELTTIPMYSAVYKAPISCLLSFEMVQWLLLLKENLISVNQACQYFQAMLNDSLILPFSNVPLPQNEHSNSKFIYGTYLYYIPSLVLNEFKRSHSPLHLPVLDYFFEVEIVNVEYENERNYNKDISRKYIVFNEHQIAPNSSFKTKKPVKPLDDQLVATTTLKTISKVTTTKSQRAAAIFNFSTAHLNKSSSRDDSNNNNTSNDERDPVTGSSPVGNSNVEKVLLHYMSTYDAGRYAFEIAMEWLSATPNYLTNHLIGKFWKRAATKLNLHLFPVLMDPFYYARPNICDQDPLRLPVFLPMNTNFIRDFYGQIFESPNSRDTNDILPLLKPSAIKLLDDMLRQRFGYIKHLPFYTNFSYEKNGTRLNIEKGNNINNINNNHDIINDELFTHEYVHFSGGMFIALEIQAKSFSTSKLSPNIPILENATKLTSKALRYYTIGYRWSWNFLLTKKWRLSNFSEESLLENAFEDFKTSLVDYTFLANIFSSKDQKFCNR